MLFANPVSGTIYLTPSGSRWYRSQRFGCTGFAWERPLGGCAHFHRGIDIAGKGCGDDVLAAAAGTVHFAGKVNDGAIVVNLNHGGGWFTSYAHLGREVVSPGQAVKQGQKIGEVGATGNATGCHLHWAVKSAATGHGSILDDGDGKWEDPWTHLLQNVPSHPTIHPVPWDGNDIHIRTSPGPLTAATIYADARKDGHIHRLSNGADLGATSTPRNYGGHVQGAAYQGSTTWEKLELPNALGQPKFFYIHTLLAVRSA